jgi:hypothetical protein
MCILFDISTHLILTISNTSEILQCYICMTKTKGREQWKGVEGGEKGNCAKSCPTASNTEIVGERCETTKVG